MQTPSELLSTQDQLKELAAKLRQKKVIAVDTEFIRETTFFPKIALIQIGTEDEVFLVDPVNMTAEELAPLVEILCDEKIVKVMHAAYADQECFYWAFGRVAEKVFDTSVAAALLGMGENIGLSKLSREVLGIHLPKGRARAKWLMRPLPRELSHYAEEDVRHLVRLYDNLVGRLGKKGRTDWAFEEGRIEPESFEEPPSSIAKKIGKNANLDARGQATLTELVRWRENRAREANLPRQWVSDNDILLSLSRVRPKTLDELKTFRGLNAKEVQRSGASILEAIHVAEGVALPEGEVLNSPREFKTKLSEHVLDFIHTYMSYLAHHHGISPRFLLTSAQADLLGLYPTASVEEWVANGVLSERAAKLIGIELRGLLDGEKALALKEGDLSILDLKK